MTRVMLLLASLALVGSGGCGSRVETRRKIEASEGKEDTAGSEEDTGYRKWEGSPGQSSEDANAQLGGY